MTAKRRRHALPTLRQTMTAAPPTLKYLNGYAPHLLAEVRRLLGEGRLGRTLRQRYPQAHEVRTDGALYDYVAALKARHMRNAGPLSKVAYDNRLRVIQHALGTHTTVSRVQGDKLKAKREIRVASLFRDAPAPFLKMIVVHELAHLKEREHDKPFYALCMHMEPDYHQLEFDLRLWLTARDLEDATADTAGQEPAQTGLP
jgi:UTP pyrophosphatase